MKTKKTELPKQKRKIRQIIMQLFIYRSSYPPKNAWNIFFKGWHNFRNYWNPHKNGPIWHYKTAKMIMQKHYSWLKVVELSFALQYLSKIICFYIWWCYAEMILYTDTMIDHELSTFVHLKDIHPINKTSCHIHIICHFSKIEMLF